MLLCCRMCSFGQHKCFDIEPPCHAEPVKTDAWNYADAEPCPTAAGVAIYLLVFRRRQDLQQGAKAAKSRHWGGDTPDPWGFLMSAQANNQFKNPLYPLPKEPPKPSENGVKRSSDSQLLEAYVAAAVSFLTACQPSHCESPRAILILPWNALLTTESHHFHSVNAVIWQLCRTGRRAGIVQRAPAMAMRLPSVTAAGAPVSAARSGGRGPSL